MYEIYPESNPELILKHLFNNLEMSNNLVIPLHYEYVKIEKTIIEYNGLLLEDESEEVKSYYKGSIIDLNKQLKEIIKKIKALYKTKDYEEYIMAIKTYEAVKMIYTLKDVYENDDLFLIRQQNYFKQINWKSLIDQLKNGKLTIFEIYDLLNLSNNKGKILI